MEPAADRRTPAARTPADLLRAQFGNDRATCDDHPDLDDPELSSERIGYIGEMTESKKAEFFRIAAPLLERVEAAERAPFLEAFTAWTADNMNATWSKRSEVFENLHRLYEDNGIAAIIRWGEAARGMWKGGLMFGDSDLVAGDRGARFLSELLAMPIGVRGTMLKEQQHTR